MAAKLGGRNAPRQAPNPPKNTPTPRGIGDNSGDLEEAERVQLISFIGRIETAEIEVDKAKAPYDAAKKTLNSIKKLAHAAGFTSEEIKRRRAEMDMTPSEKVAFVARETRHRRWLRVIDDDQTKMHLEPGQPIEARDEMDWQARGYSQGLRGIPAKLPEGIPPRMDQFFLKGHEVGHKAYMEALAANVPKKLEVRDQAAKDFAEDNPEIDVAKAARKLKNDPAFMDRTAPPEEASAPEGDAGNDDGFEATPEELSQQQGRRVHDEDNEAGEVV